MLIGPPLAIGQACIPLVSRVVVLGVDVLRCKATVESNAVSVWRLLLRRHVDSNVGCRRVAIAVLRVAVVHGLGLPASRPCGTALLLRYVAGAKVCVQSAGGPAVLLASPVSTKPEKTVNPEADRS